MLVCFEILTTRNSFLSTRWLPSVSNILNAILNPDFGSKTNRSGGIWLVICMGLCAIMKNECIFSLYLLKSIVKINIRYRIWCLCHVMYETSGRNLFLVEVLHPYIYWCRPMLKCVVWVVLKRNDMQWIFRQMRLCTSCFGHLNKF